MSIEVLREEVHQLVDTSDYDSIVRAKEALLNEQGAKDWWDELPDEVKASIEEGIRQADAGEVITLEEFKRQNARWFRG